MDKNDRFNVHSGNGNGSNRSNLITNDPTNGHGAFTSSINRLHKNHSELVPFQGINTRLRRSRSKDHSNDYGHFQLPSTLSTSGCDVMNLKRFVNIKQSNNRSPSSSSKFPNQINDYESSLLSDKNGEFFSNTLDRSRQRSQHHPLHHHQNGNAFESDHSRSIMQKYFNLNQSIDMKIRGHSSSSKSTHQYLSQNDSSDQDHYYHTMERSEIAPSRHLGSSTSDLYEESRLMQHQYEEPQYLINSSFNHRNESILTSRSQSSNHHHHQQYQDQVGPTTTIITPSKLFAKTLSSCK